MKILIPIQKIMKRSDFWIKGCFGTPCMLVNFVKIILIIPGLLKYFEIMIVVITEEPLKEKALDFETLISKSISVFIVIKEKCSQMRSPVSQFCHICHNKILRLREPFDCDSV